MPRAKQKPASPSRRRKDASIEGAAHSTAELETAKIAAEVNPAAAFHSEEATDTELSPVTLDQAAPALILPDCLDSAAATTIKEMLLSQRGNVIAVDASQVRRVGVQSLQVLVAAARTWQRDGISYRLENPSPEFLETIALVGLPRQDLLLEGHQ